MVTSAGDVRQGGVFVQASPPEQGNKSDSGFLSTARRLQLGMPYYESVMDVSSFGTNSRQARGPEA